MPKENRCSSRMFGPTALEHTFGVREDRQISAAVHCHLKPDTCLRAIAWKATAGHLKPVVTKSAVGTNITNYNR